MITIVHGTDTALSRKYFLDEKEKHPESQILNGEKISLTDLAQIFESSGLFEDTKAIFIENLFNRKKNKAEFAKLTEYLQKQKNYNIFLWEAKELDKSSLLNFKTAIPRIFKLPQALFFLLDSLKPGNGKQLISLFHQTLESAEVEMVFFMLVRQIRLLLAIANSKQVQIDELKRLAPWQKDKLKKQSSEFPPGNLLELYNKLFRLEIAQKTGNLSSTLVFSIDFLLLEI